MHIPNPTTRGDVRTSDFGFFVHSPATSQFNSETEVSVVGLNINDIRSFAPNLPFPVWPGDGAPVTRS